ncbi:alcohol dehydrogenase [Bordetella pertussis]|nr:alcohol dehydrogenase [Bordetella pertussis]
MFEFCTHARTLVGAGASDALGETLAARWGASRFRHTNLMGDQLLDHFEST